jgi:hypothetical protein
MQRVRMLSSNSRRCGVFGSTMGLTRNPSEKWLSHGIPQSRSPGVGFAKGAGQGTLKFWVTENGGLKPGLGFDDCPVA